jgi:hypothetical protein
MKKQTIPTFLLVLLFASSALFLSSCGNSHASTSKNKSAQIDPAKECTDYVYSVVKTMFKGVSQNVYNQSIAQSYIGAGSGQVNVKYGTQSPQGQAIQNAISNDIRNVYYGNLSGALSDAYTTIKQSCSSLSPTTTTDQAASADPAWQSPGYCMRVSDKKWLGFARALGANVATMSSRCPTVITVTINQNDPSWVYFTEFNPNADGNRGLGNLTNGHWVIYDNPCPGLLGFPGFSVQKGIPTSIKDWICASG